MADFLEDEKYNKNSIFETFSFYDLKKPDDPDFYPVLQRLVGELQSVYNDLLEKVPEREYIKVSHTPADFDLLS